MTIPFRQITVSEDDEPVFITRFRAWTQRRLVSDSLLILAARWLILLSTKAPIPVLITTFYGHNSHRVIFLQPITQCCVSFHALFCIPFFRLFCSQLNHKLLLWFTEEHQQNQSLFCQITAYKLCRWMVCLLMIDLRYYKCGRGCHIFFLLSLRWPRRQLSRFQSTCHYHYECPGNFVAPWDIWILIGKSERETEKSPSIYFIWNIVSIPRKKLILVSCLKIFFFSKINN